LENKELKQAQTKKSMEDTKAVQQDKGIKTKAERDRRIKELNEKNVKVSHSLLGKNQSITNLLSIKVICRGKKKAGNQM
jgi:hypothetical protein